MLRGLYMAGMGLQVQEKKMDVVSNNLANVNTNGFKKDSTVFESFDSVLLNRVNDNYAQANPSGKVGNMNLAIDVGQVYTNYTQGSITNTGTKTDFAISNSDNSFFTVEVPSGNETVERYTRDGSFTLDSTGKLVTKEGYKVLGEDGPITLTSTDFHVNEKGEVIENGQTVGKLKIKTFKDTSTLRKIGDNLLSVEGTSEDGTFEGKVMQGYTENSNVNSIKEMIDMINIVKAYEANQKMVNIQDQELGKAVNDLPSLR